MLGGNHTPHLTDFIVQAVKTARVVVPPWSKDTGHPDSRLFPVTGNCLLFSHLKILLRHYYAFSPANTGFTLVTNWLVGL